MRKSVNRAEFKAAVACLVELRKKAGLNQTDLATLLRYTQPYVSAAEIGFRRLDILQLYDWCRACGSDLQTLGRMIDLRLAGFSEAKQKKESPRPRRTKD